MCGIYGRFTSERHFKEICRKPSDGTEYAGRRNTDSRCGTGINGDVILEQIEKLAGLKDKGILSEEEYQQKKAQLLAKL